LGVCRKGGLKLLDGLRFLVVGMLQRKLMEVLALRAQKRDRPTACPASVYARRDSEPLLLFEELVSLRRWDCCKLMEVLALRAQKRDRPTACPASVYARRDSEPLLLFEELVSLRRWDRCKLMEVLTTQT